MEKEDQHTIPRSYLKAWRDPATPNGAFIWVFPRPAGQGERRSPRSTFAEEDFYTLPGESGERDLSVENALGVIEGVLVGVRDGALRQRRPLSGTEKDDLCAFVVLTWHIDEGYRPIDDDVVMEVNRSVRGHCHRSFVVSRKVTKPGWFEPLPPILRKA